MIQEEQALSANHVLNHVRLERDEIRNELI